MTKAKTMKKLFILVLLAFTFQSNANPIVSNNEDCETKVVKATAYKNGLVKKTNGEMVSNQETMSVEIDPCNQTVLIELNKKTYDLVLYKTDESGTIHAATLNGKQIIKIKINSSTNEVETLIDDLVFTTYITPTTNDRPIAVED
jgi:hypothetical protein